MNTIEVSEDQKKLTFFNKTLLATDLTHKKEILYR
ncbi:hypothetical protein PBAL39_20014 [Pedobacter sp. BAL39]|nr:hypothetical protein PBAL39_20014 [Pedobacter sp. BAL39]